MGIQHSLSSQTRRLLAFSASRQRHKRRPSSRSRIARQGALSTTILDVGPSYSQVKLDNNFASLTAAINSLIGAELMA